VVIGAKKLRLKARSHHQPNLIALRDGALVWLAGVIRDVARKN